MSEMDLIRQAIQRIKTGEFSEVDIQTVLAALAQGQLVLAKDHSAVSVEGNISSSQVFTGHNNIAGNDNAVIHIYGSDMQALQAVLAKYSDSLVQDEVNQGNYTQHRDKWSARKLQEKTLITKIKQRVKGRLKKSLFIQDTKPINLSKKLEPNLVDCLWNKDIKVGPQKCAAYSKATSILEIFQLDETAGKLLIVGNPGAGKTTIMLELANSLLDISSEQPDEPIPIILNLSSWQMGQPIYKWISLETKAEYGCSEKFIKKLLDNQKITVLLDGLDELTPKFQEPCIQAVNEFLSQENQPLYLVVCSRRDEYISREIRLNLNQAVCLLPLDDMQIEQYLEESKSSDIWPLFCQDKTLLELARTPLFLSILLVVREEINFQDWSRKKTLEERLATIWDSYFQKRMNHENKKEKPYYALEEARRWLHWLASHLNGLGDENRLGDDFIVSELQPYIVLNKKNRALYYFVLCAFITIAISLSIFLKASSSEALSLSEVSLQLIALTSLVGLTPLWGDVIQPIERLVSFNEEYRLAVFITLIMGLLSRIFHNFGSMVVLTTTAIVFILPLLALAFFGKFPWRWFFRFSGIFPLFLADSWLTENISNVWCASTISGLFFGQVTQAFLIRRNLQGKIISNSYKNSHSNQGIRRSLINATTAGVTVGCFAGLNSNAFNGTSLFLIFWLISGGAAFIQHVILRLILYTNNDIPWDYSDFLDYATDRTLLQRIGGSYKFIHLLLQEHFLKVSFEQDKSEGAK